MSQNSLFFFIQNRKKRISILRDRKKQWSFIKEDAYEKKTLFGAKCTDGDRIFGRVFRWNQWTSWRYNRSFWRAQSSTSSEDGAAEKPYAGTTIRVLSMTGQISDSLKNIWMILRSKQESLLILNFMENPN